MAKYQGHKNWNSWNVSLWINNDEGMYRLAQRCLSDAFVNVGRKYQKLTPRGTAAALMLGDLASEGITHTPDGAPYSVTTIRAAMRGM